MVEDQLRTIIDAVRSRLQAELETHLGSLAETHQKAIEEARRDVEAAAEQRSATRLDEARGEWDAHLKSEVASVRTEVERVMTAEAQRVRVEAEQSAADAAMQARRELEEAVAAERTRAQADLERAQAERERAHADLERAHAELERAQADRERAHTDRERAQADLERAHSELEHAKTDLQRAQTDLASAHTDRERAQADFERAHGELEHAKTDRQRAQTDLASAHTDRDRMQADLERALGDLEQAQADLQRAQSDVVSAQADLQRARADVASAQTDVASAKGDVARTQEDLARTREELQRAQAQRDAAHAQRDAAHAQAEEARVRADRELTRARAAFDAERLSAAAAAAAQPQVASSSRAPSGLLEAVRAIDQSPSLSEALAAAVRGAALESPRVALFIVNGTVLQEWPVDGVASGNAGQFSSDGEEAGFLTDVLRSGEVQSIDGTNGRAAPAFAGLPAGRQAIAVPFVLGGQPVAVLYADEGTDGEPLASWRETVQVLGHHASAFLAYLTAMRTAQALKMIAGGPAGNDSQATDDDEHGARRYARLLVSEIKMYNDSAVRAGRERRDLLQRLKPEIDRARRLYEERIAPSHARDLYFQQELVQTLADGDHSLLG